MEQVAIKVKKLCNGAVVPQYAKPGDAGMDLTAVTKSVDIHADGSRTCTYGTGIAVEHGGLAPCGRLLRHWTVTSMPWPSTTWPILHAWWPLAW